jgi:small-conductance mechanosensitive channel
LNNPTPQDRLKTTHELLRHIINKLREHGVEIPCPQRDLHRRSVDPTVELLAADESRRRVVMFLDDDTPAAMPDLPARGAGRDESR